MTTGSFSVRWRILALLVALVLPGIGDAAAQDKRFDGITLRVGTYGGTWREVIHALIGAELERRGAKIEYVIGNPRDNMAKLIAARGQRPPFDVIELTDLVKIDAVTAGLLAKLNYANLPNAVQHDANQREEHAVATWVSQEGIVYNTERYKELGLPKPERYSDLLNPKLKGRVSFPDVNVGGAANGIIGFAADAGGDEGNIDPGLQLIKQLDVTSFSKSSVDLATQFKSGDVWAAVWHAGYAVRVHRSGVPVAMSFPKVKDKVGMIQLGWVAMVRNASQPEAIEFFINRYLAADVQEELARRNGVGPMSKAASAKLLQDPVLKQFMLLRPDEIRNTYYADWAKYNASNWSEKWNRTIAR